MPTLPAWLRETEHLGDYADLDPAILASLRTSADEDALAAAFTTQLTVTAAQGRHTASVILLRRGATDEQRAA